MGSHVKFNPINIRITICLTIQDPLSPDVQHLLFVSISSDLSTIGAVFVSRFPVLLTIAVSGRCASAILAISRCSDALRVANMFFLLPETPSDRKLTFNDTLLQNRLLFQCSVLHDILLSLSLSDVESSRFRGVTSRAGDLSNLVRGLTIGVEVFTS